MEGTSLIMALSITTTQENDTIIINLEGRLDVIGAKEAEAVFVEAVEKDADIILDMSELAYTASAGLRVIKRVNKGCKDKGHKLILRNVCDDVMEVFEITGFAAMLTFEE